MRTMILLNETGDSTISWTPEADDRIRSLIERKMKEGVTFFIIKKRTLRFLPGKKIKLTNIDQLGKERKVFLGDEEFQNIAEDGLLSYQKRASGEIKTTGTAKTSDEVIQNSTVAVRAMRGG